MSKKLMVTLLALCMGIILVACGGDAAHKGLTKDDNPDKGLEVFGDNVKYDPNKLVNDGEPIALELWTWHGVEVFQKYIDEYKEIYPNVEITVVNNPWDEMWTKLPLALRGEDGPALFNVHNSQHNNLINFMAPYDIATEELEADFVGVASHVIDGDVHYFDYGIMTGSIFYNKDLWAEAGLTEADIPTTWDELAEVAQKLTKTDDNGRLIQAGFNFNGEVYQAIIAGLGYQRGDLLFKEDGKTVNFYSDAKVEATQMFYDLYNEYNVGSPNFGDDSSQSFGNGQSAMVYKWGWMQGELRNNYPEINWGVFQTPTPTGDVPFAIDRYNGESTPGINKNASPEQQAVAQDFVRFLLAGEGFSKDFSLLNSTFPTKYSLANDPEVLADPVLNVLSENIERYIWPGSFPAVIETVSGQVFQEIFFNNVDVEEAMKAGQEQIESGMESSDFTSVEENYLFFSEK